MNKIVAEVEKAVREFFKDAPVMFLKFSNNLDHIKSLQEGNLFMNNLQYYIDLEEKSGEAGMGDRLEALNVVNDVDISIFDIETNELLAKVPATSANLRYDDTLNKPVFCLFAVTLDMLEIIEANENVVKFSLNFNNQELGSMKKSFGEHVLIIMAHPFFDKVNKTFTEKNYEFYSNMVEYLDYSVNDMKRITSHLNRSTELFFYKDKAFEHQKEYRIVIFNKEIAEGSPEHIGSLKGFSLIRNIEDLGSAGGLGFQFNPVGSYSDEK